MAKTTRFASVLIFVLSAALYPFHAALAEQNAYMGIMGGYTFSPSASWSEDNSDYEYDISIQETGIFGFKLGATAPSPENFVSAEFEYSYLNPNVDRTVLATAGDDYSAIEGNVVIHNFMFNVIVNYPQGKIHPYIGLGAGVSYFDFSLQSTSRVDGVNYSERRSSDDTVFAWQVLAGVDIDLTRNLSLDIGGRYFNAQYLNAEYNVYYGDDNTEVEYHHDEDYYDGPTFDYRTFMVTIGLKLKF